MYRLPLHRYLIGWAAFRVLMLWPSAYYDRTPRRLHGWAWGYAEDERSYPKDQPA